MGLGTQQRNKRDIFVLMYIILIYSNVIHKISYINKTTVWSECLCSPENSPIEILTLKDDGI